MLLFHGTTVSNALNILEEGFSYHKNNWSCSEEKTYFFTGKYFQNEFGIETEEEVLSYGIQEALQQSMISLAIENPSDYRGAVLVFDSRFMNNKDEIEADHSCPNMSEMAVALKNPDMQGLVGFYIMDEDVKSFRLITLSSLNRSQYINEVSLSSIEEQLMEVIAKSDNLLCNANDIFSQISYSKQSINQTTGLRAA